MRQIVSGSNLTIWDDTNVNDANGRTWIARLKEKSPKVMHLKQNITGDDRIDLFRVLAELSPEEIYTISKTVSETSLDNGLPVNLVKMGLRFGMVEYLQKMFLYGRSIPLAFRIDLFSTENEVDAMDNIEMTGIKLGLVHELYSRGGNNTVLNHYWTFFAARRMQPKFRKPLEGARQVTSNASSMTIPYELLWTPKEFGGLGKMQETVVMGNSLVDAKLIIRYAVQYPTSMTSRKAMSMSFIGAQVKQTMRLPNFYKELPDIKEKTDAVIADIPYKVTSASTEAHKWFESRDPDLHKRLTNFLPTESPKDKVNKSLGALKEVKQQVKKQKESLLQVKFDYKPFIMKTSNFFWLEGLEVSFTPYPLPVIESPMVCGLSVLTERLIRLVGPPVGKLDAVIAEVHFLDKVTSGPYVSSELTPENFVKILSSMSIVHSLESYINLMMTIGHPKEKAQVLAAQLVEMRIDSTRLSQAIGWNFANSVLGYVNLRRDAFTSSGSGEDGFVSVVDDFNTIGRGQNMALRFLIDFSISLFVSQNAFTSDVKAATYNRVTVKIVDRYWVNRFTSSISAMRLRKVN
jgi:hypothetical protein